jgi:ribosomal protein S18 acetylase RimI-like enzyme
VRPMEIREFRSDDAEDAARLYLQSAEHHTELDSDFYRIPDLEAVVAYYEDLAGEIKTEPLACFVAESDGNLVGTVEVRISDLPSRHSMLRPRYIGSVDIVVDPDRRHQGIGKALMQRAETWARDQGATSLMLDMLRANEQALAFYTALGYEDHGALLLKRHIDPG